MAQESVRLNKNLLKHLRHKADEKQEYTAEACGLSNRQYQNIENKGYTSSATISRIAEHFNISPEELMTKISEDNSLWYVTDPYFLAGRVDQGYDKALGEIKNQAKSVADIFSPKLVIKNNEQLKEITLSYNENDYSWTLRPLKLNKKIGLVWTDLSEWQQEDWNDAIDELIYGCVFDVHINGSPLIPIECTPQFLVKFNEVGKNKSINKGYRLFKSDAEFRVSLTEWVDTHPTIISSNRFNKGSLNFIYDFADEMTKSVTIFRVWLDKEGKKHKAPWPLSNIEKVVTAITDKKDGKRRWAIPIGPNGIFTGDKVATMTPEVTCNEITELPEFSFPTIEITHKDD